MSGWHREHPELTGTDADPWMQIPGHAAAAREAMYAAGNLDARIAAHEAAHEYRCTADDCAESQPAGETCRECGARIAPDDREPPDPTY